MRVLAILSLCGLTTAIKLAVHNETASAETCGEDQWFDPQSNMCFDNQYFDDEGSSSIGENDTNSPFANQTFTDPVGNGTGEEYMCMDYNETDCHLWEPCSVVDCSQLNGTSTNVEPSKEYICRDWNETDCTDWVPCSGAGCDVNGTAEGTNGTDGAEGNNANDTTEYCANNPGGQIWEWQCKNEIDGSETCNDVLVVDCSAEEDSTTGEGSWTGEDSTMGEGSSEAPAYDPEWEKCMAGWRFDPNSETWVECDEE